MKEMLLWIGPLVSQQHSQTQTCIQAHMLVAVGEANRDMVERDILVQEIGFSMVGIQVLVGTGMSGTGSHLLVVATEFNTGRPQKGSEFVNSMKAGTARKVHHVAICIRDFWLDTASIRHISSVLPLFVLGKIGLANVVILTCKSSSQSCVIVLICIFFL